MKGNLRKQKEVTTKYEKQQFLKHNSQIPKGKTKMDKLVETLARMWIKCDPNRGDTNPDDLINLEGGTMNGQPEWKWFVPRAQATIKFLKENGYEIKRVD